MQSSSLLRGNAPSFSNNHQFYNAGVLLMILFSFTAFANAQSSAPEKQWDKTFGGTRLDVLTCMINTPDGGYLLGGNSSSDTGGDKSEDFRDSQGDYSIVKIDKDGRKQWDKTFG